MNCYRCATPLPDDARFCLSCGADVSGEAAERTQPVDADPELQNELQADLGGDFHIERELGRGGMAVVYLATDVHLGRNVAIKVLPPELTFAGGPHIVERFKREARTAATLDHPHVIPIHRVSTSGKLSTRLSIKKPSRRAPGEAPVGTWPRESPVRTRMGRTVR